MEARQRFDVVVVGAGIIGTAVTWHLARSGISVALVDRSFIGTEASGRNAGSLHGQIPQEVFFQESETDGQIAGRRFLPALAFLLSSLTRWDRLSKDLGTDLEVVTNGGLVLIDDPRHLKQAERKVALETSVGLHSRLLDRGELRAIAPWVAERVIGATFSPVEGKANPLIASAALARAAETHGAVIFPNTAVDGIEIERTCVRCQTGAGSLTAERLVLVAGDGLRSLTRLLNFDLPITTEPVQVAATEALEPVIHHLVYYAGERLTLKQANAGTVLIGGGWPARLEPGTGYPIVELESLRDNLRVALRVAPFLSNILVIRSWAGIGNGTPDLLPILGPLPGADRVLVGLFPYMGFTAGPLMGEILADLIIGRKPELDLAPFRLNRFYPC